MQTVAVLQTFFLAMILNPLVLKRAQEEIDHVIGSDRLPSLADRQNLPFNDALLKETLRWQNAVPTGRISLSFTLVRKGLTLNRCCPFYYRR